MMRVENEVLLEGKTYLAARAAGSSGIRNYA